MNKQQINSLVSDCDFRTALVELDKINHSFSKSNIILKWEDIKDKAAASKTILSSEQCEEMSRDLYGSDGMSGVIKELIAHIDSINMYSLTM